MEQPAAGHLGRQHPGKPFGVLVEQNGVIEYPRGVEYSFQGQRTCTNPGEEGAHGRFISHIDLGDLDGDPLCRQRGNGGLLGFIGYRVAPGQDQICCPLFGQPLGHHQPQRTQATGDEVAGIGLDRNGTLTMCAAFTLHQSRHMTFALTIGHLRFTRGGWLQNFGQQQLCGGVDRTWRALVRRKIDQTAPQLTMFQRHDPPQAPQWGLIRGYRFTSSKLLCALRDDPQACGNTVIVCSGAAKGLDELHHTVKVARLGLHQRNR